MPTQFRMFVLYCHISPNDENRLVDLQSDIQWLLTSGEDQQGLLILFLDTGLEDLLKMIHPIKRQLDRAGAKAEKERLKQDLLARSSKLNAGKARGDRLQAALGTDVRVLTAIDLVDVFGEMTAVENLKKFLLGIGGEIRYDTPKFVEAIVRLRMIGSRVPVLRLDRDVLIPPDGELFPRTALVSAIQQIRSAVQRHHENTQVLATILSANYETPADGSNDVMSFNSGYATRILPSLLLPTDEDATTFTTSASANRNWKAELQRHFRRDLTINFLENLWRWGAPTTGVISGALLYMNDSVVLNAPPFSNFSQRVMWIDDHLRYVLHRETGDFCRQTIQKAYGTGRPLHVFYPTVQVRKYRVAENFLLHTIRDYLPSLMWGSFFDYWLCPSEILKRRQEEVQQGGPNDLKLWEDQRREGRPGILAKAIHEARAGCLPDEGLLRESLQQDADVRLTQLRKVWGDLRSGESHTLASAWVHGQLPPSLQTALSTAIPKIAPRLPEKVELFEDGLRDGFNEVLDDTCRYVKWVFEWPHVVSVIRSVAPGEFRSDLEWS